MNRRTFIAVCSALGVSTTAGCVGNAGDDGSTGDINGYVRPDDDPDVIPGELHCDAEESERHRVEHSEDAVQFGDTAEFSLRGNSLSVEYGESVQITLRNTTDETVETGNKHKYNLECYTQAGWQEVRVWTSETTLPYTDEAISHEPGEGFEWNMELTEEGIPAATIHEDDLQVCPELESGRYRFTYWGLIGEDAIAIEFDLARDD